MKEFVRKRLDKAQRSLEAADREVESGNPDFAAERAYYAMFYATDALLAHHELRYRSHGAFGRHFVGTGLFEAEHHRALLDAFEARQLATYGVDVGMTGAQAHRASSHGPTLSCLPYGSICNPSLRKPTNESRRIASRHDRQFRSMRPSSS